MNVFLYSSSWKIANILKDLNIFHFMFLGYLGRISIIKYMHERLDFPF